jgi:hypothetical protein
MIDIFVNIKRIDRFVKPGQVSSNYFPERSNSLALNLMTRPHGHKAEHHAPTGKNNPNILPMMLIQTNNLTRRPMIRHTAKMANRNAIHSMEINFDPIARAMGNLLSVSFPALHTTREQPATHCTGQTHPQYQRPQNKEVLIPRSRTGNQNRSILKRTSTASVIDAAMRTDQRRDFTFLGAKSCSDLNMV